jgi:hypothetical protein
MGTESISGARDDRGPSRDPGHAPFLLPGVRVTLRYRIDPSTAPHGESMTDALGWIAEVDDVSVTVGTRRGPVRVPRALVLAAKPVPDPPRRRTA